MEDELELLNTVYNTVVSYLVESGFLILYACIILVIGFIVGRKLGDVVLGICQKKNLDITLSRFFGSCVRLIVIGFAFMLALSRLNIEITPFVAAIGAIGLGAGLAVQGLLSNYGAGLSIILTRPFVVGDTIKVLGVAGVVREVHLAYTILGNEDNEKITIPNRHILGEIIHNSQSDSMLELDVGIAYGSDPQQAVTVILEALAGITGISKVRSPQVGIHEFADSGINMGVRVWVQTELLFETRYRCNMAIHQGLKSAGIVIPFPQREVRMLES